MESEARELTIPAVSTIRDQIISYTQTRLGQNIPMLSRAFIFVMATAVAGVLVLSYYFANWCLDQTQPATCNEFWLQIWGDRYGVTRDAAVAAQLTLTATGSDGSTIPSGQLYTDPNSVVYQVTALATIAGGTATVSVTCLTAGIIGNQANGTAMALVSPLSGINSSAVVASTVLDGVDRESVAQFRSEVLNRIANKPQGGAVPDYVIWSLQVPGVVKVFVKRTGSNDVTVYALDALTGAGRVADAPTLAALLAYLNDPIRKPLAANVYTLAPTERTCAVTVTTATINGSALTTAQQNSVVAAITTALYAAYPRQYPDDPNPTDTVSTAIVWNALLAIGATAASVTINISGIGGGPYVLPIGEIVAPGAFVWA
jgi:uncharacterized phage protein gp47/JayE